MVRMQNIIYSVDIREIHFFILFFSYTTQKNLHKKAHTHTDKKRDLLMWGLSVEEEEDDYKKKIDYEMGGGAMRYMHLYIFAYI